MGDNMNGLTEKRKAKGLSLAETARALGLAFQTYCNYEYGRRQAPYVVLKAMAQFFECTIDELL